jgi:hypothetical protein
MSSVHCQFTPTTLALAAVSWAFEVRGISWNSTVKKGKPEEEKMPVWEHYRRFGALSANGCREDVLVSSIDGVLSPNGRHMRFPVLRDFIGTEPARASASAWGRDNVDEP